MKGLYKHIRVYALVLAGLFFIGAEKAREINIESSSDKIYPGKGREVIRCLVRPDILRGNPPTELRFFAKNNISGNYFELKDEHYELVKTTPKKKGKRRIVILEIPYDKLFYKKDISAPYKWDWSGRAQTPPSPISDWNNGQVTTIECWFSLKAGSTTYASNIISLQVVQ